MNKYQLVGSVCIGWVLSVSAGADNSAPQTQLPAEESQEMSSMAFEVEQEQPNPSSATTSETGPPGAKQKDKPYVTPLREYNNNGVFGN